MVPLFRCQHRKCCTFTIITVLLLLFENVDQAFSIKCRQCEKRFGSCDDGECSGKACVLVEVSNAQKSTVVKKTCSLEQHYKSECTVSYPDGIESILCYCVYDYCNSDAELEKIGFAHSKQNGNVNGVDEENAISSSAGSPIIVAANNGDRNKRTNLSSSQTFGMSTNYLVMLIFMCLFITGSFSLLIFNTVCVHLC